MSNKQAKHLGLLQPLAIPKRKWDSISMDFIVDPLRIQKGFNSIFVVDEA
jgi:hypothetical protein